MCNVYWIFKTVYLTFFYNTGDSHMVLKKRNFASSTLFSLSPSRTHISLSPSFQRPVAGAAGHAAVHASVTCPAYKSKVKCFTLIWKEKSSPQIVCIYVLKQRHVNTYMQCLWSKSKIKWKREEEVKPYETEKIGCLKWTKSFFLKNKKQKTTKLFTSSYFFSLLLQRDIKWTN